MRRSKGGSHQPFPLQLLLLLCPRNCPLNFRRFLPHAGNRNWGSSETTRMLLVGSALDLFYNRYQFPGIAVYSSIDFARVENATGGIGFLEHRAIRRKFPVACVRVSKTLLYRCSYTRGAS